MSIESIADSERWNDFVVSSGKGHLLQSFEWGEFKGKFGWEVERVAIADQGKIAAGAQVFFRRTPIGPMAYVPRGPLTRDGSSEQLRLLLEGIHDVARDHKAIFLKIEPNDCSFPESESLGFNPSPESIQPHTSIHVDLTPDLDGIAGQQKPKTRYNIRLASRRGVAVREGGLEQLPAFYELLKVTSKRDGFLIHNYDYYREAMASLGDKARLFAAFFEEEVLASIMVMAFAGEAIYMYGASSNSGRNLMPTYLLQWEAMRWAKSLGCTRYDLWGIPDEVWEIAQDDAQDDELDERFRGERREGLWGVYHFKKGFGGATVRYAGSYDYVYAAMRYWAWQKALPLYTKLLSRAVA